MVMATSFGGFSRSSRQRAASHINAVESGPPETARISAGKLSSAPNSRRASAGDTGPSARSRARIAVSVPARAGEAVIARLDRCSLEHDPEKWVPVFGKDHAQTKS